jgi:hypothetical protein
VVEWLMAPVLKTGVPKGTVGSNPTPSVINESEAIRGHPKSIAAQWVWASSASEKRR